MLDRAERLRKLALNVARYSGMAPLARTWAAGVGAILMLHRVTDAPGKPLGINRHLSITPGFLDRMIADMKTGGYEFVSLDEAVERLDTGGGGKRFAAITADDAYRDNLIEALPVFEKHEAPVTIYVAPGLIDGAVELWWDLIEDAVGARDQIRVPAPGGYVNLDCSTTGKKCEANAWLHNHLTRYIRETDQSDFVRNLAGSLGLDCEASRRAALMTWKEIRQIASHELVTIGAHTVNHYNLRRLSEEAARREMVDAADILYRKLGEKPRHMAYPYGYEAAVGPREVRLAGEAGFVSAVTTRHGVLHRQHAEHPHSLPRISINGRYQSLPHVRTMLTGITTPLANRGKLVVTV